MSIFTKKFTSGENVHEAVAKERVATEKNWNQI